MRPHAGARARFLPPLRSRWRPRPAPRARRTPARRRSALSWRAAPGGFLDVVARTLAQRLQLRAKRIVVVENRAGAGGNLGSRSVAESTPDGNAILVTTSSLAINETLYRNKGYSNSALTPVAFVGSAPEGLASSPNAPFMDARDLIKRSASSPITFSSAGVGSGSYIATEYLFKNVLKIPAVHVPYTGGAPAITAAIAQQVDIVAATIPPLIAPIAGGTMRGLGVADATRHPLMPNVPTYRELGFGDFNASSWVGLFVRTGTKSAVASELNAMLLASAADPEAQATLRPFGIEPLVDDVLKTGDLAGGAAFLKKETATWGAMVKALDISLE